MLAWKSYFLTAGLGRGIEGHEGNLCYFELRQSRIVAWPRYVRVRSSCSVNQSVVDGQDDIQGQQDRMTGQHGVSADDGDEVVVNNVI